LPYRIRSELSALVIDVAFLQKDTAGRLEGELKNINATLVGVRDDLNEMGGRIIRIESVVAPNKDQKQ
jgi:hypothetical protein